MKLAKPTVTTTQKTTRMADRHRSQVAAYDEALLLSADIIGVLLRRLTIDDNAADAMEMLRATLAAIAERRTLPEEAVRNVNGLYRAARRIGRRDVPGTFEALLLEAVDE